MNYLFVHQNFPSQFRHVAKIYRQHYCEELKDQINWSSVHFLGKLPYADYLKVLQISAVHVYLTYPFVLSWSMLEAMAAGCLLVASATPPVQEVIEDGKSGLLVDFFNTDRLANTISTVLTEAEAYKSIREQARQTIVQDYDLHSQCLPQILAFLKAG